MTRGHFEPNVSGGYCAPKSIHRAQGEGNQLQYKNVPTYSALLPASWPPPLPTLFLPGAGAARRGTTRRAKPPAMARRPLPKLRGTGRRTEEGAAESDNVFFLDNRITLRWWRRRGLTVSRAGPIGLHGARGSARGNWASGDGLRRARGPGADGRRRLRPGERPACARVRARCFGKTRVAVSTVLF